MKQNFLAAITVVSAVLFNSCTPLKFYSGSDFSKLSGLKYYAAKPYLQVERDINNNVVKSAVIYMPDLSEPMYIVFKGGPGSRKVDIKLTDGILTSLGIASDPKVTETIESLSALVSKTASAVSDLAALKSLPATTAASNITELYEVLITKDGTSLRKVEIK